MSRVTLLVIGPPGGRTRSLSISRRLAFVLFGLGLAGTVLLGAWAGWHAHRAWHPTGLSAPPVATAAPTPADATTEPRAEPGARWSKDPVFPFRRSPRSKGASPPLPAFAPADPLDRIRAGTAPTGLRVALVGIDGASFLVLDPMLQRQELPTLQRLIQQGSRGTLQSIRPMRSPALWTSLATGRARGDHHIIGFLDADDGTGRLVSVEDRRTAALWNVTTAFGREAGVVGWWVTWPAERVQGYVVSDRMVRGQWTTKRGGQALFGRTYPDALTAELQPLVVDPDRPPMDEIDRLAPFSPNERARFLSATRPVLAHGPSVFKFAHCAQRSYEEMAVHLLRTRPQPELFALFLGANDAISHTFWHTYEPGRFPEGIDPEEVARLGQLIPGYARHNDRLLGRLAALLGPDTVLFVVSDHGFQASGDLPERRRLRPDGVLAEVGLPSDDDVNIGQTGQHAPEGILIAAGGPVRRGARVDARIYDIAPTLLALLGLPVAEDMPGRALEELVEPDFWVEHPIRRIDSYERLIPRASRRELAERADPYLEAQLRSLGYVSDPQRSPR